MKDQGQLPLLGGCNSWLVIESKKDSVLACMNWRECIYVGLISKLLGACIDKYATVDKNEAPRLGFPRGLASYIR